MEWIGTILETIREGRGWYAMAVGVGVVFFSLVFIYAIITIMGRVFTRRTRDDEKGDQAPAPENGGPDSLPPAMPDHWGEAQDEAELAMVAAAVVAAVARFRHRAGMWEKVEASGGWRMAGRARLHGASAEIQQGRPRHVQPPSRGGGR